VTATASLSTVGAPDDTRFGMREAVVTGALWGVLVTTSESLSQPALYLEFNQFLFFYGRILLHFIVGGIALSVFVHWIALRLHSVQATIAAILAVAAATALSLFVERLTVWFVPAFSSDLMLVLVDGYVDLAVYLSWNFAFFGGAYVVAFFLFERSTWLRGQLRMAERARLLSEASLDRVLAEDHNGLLQPALLIESVAELGRRYAQGADRGDRLLDLMVRFLRSAMSGLSASKSDLAAELELAGNYGSLCRELGRPGCAITIDFAVDARTVAFPALVLLRILEEFSRKVAADSDLKLYVSRNQESIVLLIACNEVLGAALSETTERRTTIALRAIAGKGAAIGKCDNTYSQNGGTRIEITLPTGGSQGHFTEAKENQSCRE